MAFGLGGAFYGVLVGLTQTDARVLLGYSSVSQMGLMAVGLGAGVAAPGSWAALVGVVVLFAVHHAFAKAALFAGLAWSEGNRSRLRHLALLVPAAALIGLPFTSGALAKAALKGALPALPGVWAEALTIALPLATLGTTLLMARLVFVAAARGPVPSAPAPALAGTVLLLVAVVGGVWWLPGIVPVAAVSSAASGALWPALAGGLIALAVYWLDRAHGVALRVRIPPGDLSLPVERLAGALWRVVAATPEAHHGDGSEAAPSATRRPGRLAALLTRGEAALTRWELAGIALLALAAAVAVVVFRG
jgi:NADH:ubiquinone oxidoreductase subunit 5 (subunit L)/multisubunit Na+/H+ antiporter MnhA subunit